MTDRPRIPVAVLFLALAFMWGSSYFWIKVGVQTLEPITLVTLRLLFGFLVIAAVVVITRVSMPRDLRLYGHLVVMAIVNIVLPFLLITWGERSPSMDSALAAILNGTVPLFVLVIAPWFLPDERITPARFAGLAIGFAGVVVLFAPGFADLGSVDIWAAAALLGSSIAYAAGAVYARIHVRGVRPIIPAFFQVGFALLITAGLALVFEGPDGFVPATPEAMVAVLWLGIIGSGLAYLTFFRVLAAWGATRTAAVAYLLPVVGILLGAFRGEAITGERVAGTALIIGGIALVNSAAALVRRRAPVPEPSSEQPEARSAA
jgi:drug/metabolite transporter (DMT)-like permease